MPDSASSLPRGLKIGSVLVMIAAGVPVIVATTLFVSYLIGISRPADPWLAGTFPPSAASYSLDAIRKFNPFLAADFATAQHIELVNAMTNGCLIVLLAFVGLRRFQKWSWYTILITFSWLGVNDCWAMLASHQPPVPLIPISLGIIGLLVARSAIFAPQTTTVQAAAAAAQSARTR